METFKLVLAGSFATAASLRTLIALAEVFAGFITPTIFALLAGPVGIAIEGFISLIVGVLIANRIRASVGHKSEKA